MRLANVRIAHKLVLGFACILAIFAAVSVAIFGALAHVERAEGGQYRRPCRPYRLEQLTAARYDQSQTARGFIITRVERHANLYAAATKLFDETLARTKSDAAAAPDSDARSTPSRNWPPPRQGGRSEVGDPEVQLARDPATFDQAIEIAKSPKSSAHMQQFREALAKRGGLSGASLQE